MALSGTLALRAAFTSRFSAGLHLGSKQPSPSASQLTQALRMALSRSERILEPVTSAATFCSSITFQLMYFSMSGWSMSTTTILAARRVVPPDLMAPAARSPILRKLIRPEDLPPPDKGSFSPRSLEHPKVHDPALVDEVVVDRLDEAGMRLGMLVGRL